MYEREYITLLFKTHKDKFKINTVFKIINYKNLELNKY